MKIRTTSIAVGGLLSLCLLLSSTLQAQNVAINSTGAAPDASAMLDVSGSEVGILIPRMTQANRPGAPENSLLIYQTDNDPGYYYYDATIPAWVKFMNDNDGNDKWDLEGNTGTNPTNNFVGTSDNQSLAFRTNNTERMRILNSGNVGIGTASPNYRLDLANGTFGFGTNNQRTETRNNAGLQGTAGAQSGFFETSSPNNYPSGASSWWHLIDVRHSNTGNNYAMQFAGSFFDQKLYFRKTNNSATQPWTEVMTNTSFNGGITLDHTSSAITTTTTWQTITGLSRTLSLNAGDVVYIESTGGIMAISYDWSSADIGIRVNGVDLANGGYTKVSTLLFSNWTIFGSYTAPADGDYTFTVGAQRTAPSNVSASIGGDNTSVTQSSMKIQVVSQ